MPVFLWEYYGRLRVIRKTNRTDKYRATYYLCRCECGVEREVEASNLTSGNTLSCGCLRKETQSTHGKTGTSIYAIWLGIKDRCMNPSSKAYPNYGGRGITLDDTWLEFEGFYKDMGDRPKGMTLDRRDNEGNYCKDNCRWATWEEQANNKRNNRLITLEGVTKTLAQWAKEYGIAQETLLSRLNSGWDTASAVTTPVAPAKKPIRK